MSDALRKNYSQLFNGYSLPGWKLDYGKLELMVSEADAELTALRAENKRLRVDAERLNWLDNNGSLVLRMIGYGGSRDGWGYKVGGSIFGATDLREAIDAAMKGERT